MLLNYNRSQYNLLTEYYNGFKEIAALAKENHVVFENTKLNQYFVGKQERLKPSDEGRLIYQPKHTEEACLAIMFIKNAGPEYNKYQAGVCNSFAEGTD